MEKCIHFGIATTWLVTVHKGQVDNNRFVSEPSDINPMILVQSDAIFVGRIEVLLHGDRQGHRFQTSIATDRDLSLYCEVQVVVIGSQIQHGLNRSTTRQNLALLSSEKIII